MVRPAASMNCSEACRVTVMKLLQVRNEGLMAESSAIRNTSAAILDRTTNSRSRGHDERGERGQDSGIDIDRDVMEIHAGAGQRERAAIAADGEHAAAEARAVKQKPGHREAGRERPDRRRQA